MATTTARDNAVVAYQIDCQTTKKGKMFAGTKRRICWKFGFSNREAVKRGLSGTDCRGEEHEVVFVWSLTSGKKFVLADGHEVHWSKQSPISEKFDCSWQCTWESQMAGAKRELTVLSHASSGLFDKKKTNKNSSVADSSFRNIELLIDGVAFSNMPQMFELGLTKTAEDQRRIRMGGTDHLWEPNAQETVQYLQRQQQNYVHDDVDSVVSHRSQPPPQQLYADSHLQQLQQHRYQHFQQQQASRGAYFSSLSQSTPDLRYASEMVGGSVPHFKCHHTPQPHQRQQQQPLPGQYSPTSVAEAAAINPFELYANHGFKPQHRQPRVSFNSSSSTVY